MLRTNLLILNKLLSSNNVRIANNLAYLKNVRKCSTTINLQKDISKVQNDETNTFGTLTKPLEKQEVIIDEGDKLEEEYLENIVPNAKRLRTTEYANIIKDFIKKRQIQEAIDVLEKKMIKEDRAKPENYIYNLIMGACGKLGYTKKAFHLFNDMKKRGLQPTGGTYTALFNACSNSPWPEDGLSRAKKLKELMFEKGVISNNTTFNAMIKAFGRCGDIKTAFSIVDEMIENHIRIKSETINFLLQSCITNKDAGFLQALLVWRKFKQNKIVPDIYSFNLLLHCVRECQLGDPEVAKKLLENLDVSTSQIQWKENKQITGSANIDIIQKDNNSVEIYKHIPNLLSDTPFLGNMIEISEVKSPDQRLLLIGGFSGFLTTMEQNNVTPNIKTMTLLLHNLPSTLAAEETLLKYMKKRKIQFDIDFFNMLIKKRCLRFDYQNAKEVMNLFDKYKFRPNIMTYGVLALACETLEEAHMLINEMKENGYRINIEILGSLVRQACSKEHFIYVIEIMEMINKEDIKPNKMFLEHLENFRRHIKQILKDEKRRSKSWNNMAKVFLKRYKSWVEEQETDKIEETHPWDQFRQPVETNVKNYKDPKEYFKPRISSRFKVKTGTVNQNIQK